jgi:Phage integrase family/Phage integrase, N-terminal SAM-like domain
VFVGRDAVTGKPKQISRVYTAPRREPGASKREAAKQLAALVAEVEKGTQGKNGGSNSTLGELLDEYIAHIERMGRAPTTLYGYRRIVATRIGPAIRSKRLDKLTAHDLDRFYADPLASGLGDRSVHHIHRQISAALRQGRKWGWVATNVAEDATPPKLRRAEMKVPSPEQVTALITEAARPETRAPEMAAVITMLALTGMRRGELCGLRWSDVDWQGFAITVNQAIWQTREGMGAKAPKTHQARRLVLGENAMAVPLRPARPGACRRGDGEGEAARQRVQLQSGRRRRRPGPSGLGLAGVPPDHPPDGGAGVGQAAGRESEGDPG